MYDITKTRMLLTTAVAAAVAALFASGANAMLPDDGGAPASIGIVAEAAQAPSWQGKGGKGEETGSYRGQASIRTGTGAQAPSWRGKGGKGEE